MNTYPNLKDQGQEIGLSESNKFVHILFTAVFVCVVFIIPVVALICFAFSVFNRL